MSHISIGQSSLMPYQRLFDKETFLDVQGNKTSQNQNIFDLDSSIIKFPS
jgi:hypothetical protein